MIQLQFHPPIFAQVMYDFLGFFLMLGLAQLLMWYDRATKRPAHAEPLVEAKP